MKSIYYVNECYVPNCAPLNRSLALEKGIGEHDVCVNAVYLFPSKNEDEVQCAYKNVNFIYLWKKCKVNNKYIRNLYSLYLLFRMLKKDDVIIFYDCRRFLWLYRIKKNIKVYHEITEHPQFRNKHLNIFEELKYKVYLSTCRILDGLFVISPSLKEFFINEVKVDKSKVHVINMIVDIDRFQNIDRNEQSQNITYCGTISVNKDGVDILIESFIRIHNRYPNLILQLIGPFQNKEVKTRLCHIVKEYNIEKFVYFKGVVSSFEMPQMLVDSKLLVLSRPNNKQAQYGFPTKLGEYMMTGVPVLVTNVGDMHYYLRDKENIIFSESNSVDDFSNAMMWAFEHYDKAVHIGLKGREIALKLFNNYVEANKVLKIIYE